MDLSDVSSVSRSLGMSTSWSWRSSFQRRGLLMIVVPSRFTPCDQNLPKHIHSRIRLSGICNVSYGPFTQSICWKLESWNLIEQPCNCKANWCYKVQFARADPQILKTVFCFVAVMVLSRAYVGFSGKSCCPNPERFQGVWKVPALGVSKCAPGNIACNGWNDRAPTLPPGSHLTNSENQSQSQSQFQTWNQIQIQSQGPNPPLP